MSGALLRSLLFVPGDSERKQAKALQSAADALLLDLEDSVAAAQLPAARARVCELLKSQADRSRQQLWVRVNASPTGLLLQDLAAVFPGAPDGIVLPKASCAADLIQLSHYLSALEAREGCDPGRTRVLAIVTETAGSVLNLAGYAGALACEPTVRERIAGLTWGLEDLSAAMGITRKSDEHGSMTFTFQLARSLCLYSASALGVQAIDSVDVDFRDLNGLKRSLDEARRDGFTGKLAIHPDQVGPINEAFIPQANEVDWAQRVVAAFDSNPAAGVTSLDGQMIDKPHLLQAQRILELASRPRPASKEGV
jgi:citrate lyase subunit beta/citryl-CoA lyase